MNTFTKKWIRALRSGKYRQGREKLRTKAGGYCCLGVGLKIMYPKIKDFDEIVKKHNRGNDLMPALGNRKKMDISEKLSGTLAELNDRKKWKFKKIADFIAGKIDKHGKPVKKS